MSKRCCAKMCYNSQLTNKNVSYFSFPKNQGYASAWAIAAERVDLLDKSLNSLIKYFICSEHFTDDCFLDPPYNTKLKKTSRPVSAPIPTIFQCNILTQNLSNVGTPKPDPVVKQSVTKTSDKLDSNLNEKESAYFVVEEINEIDNQEAEIVGSKLSNFDDIHSMNNETSCLLLDIEVGYKMVDISSENEIHNGNDLPPFCLLQSNDLNDDETFNNSENMCRLCANVFDYSDNLIKLFSDDGEETAMTHIENVMPNMILRNDGLPQQICSTCFDKLESCANTIKSFKTTQNVFIQHQ